MIELLKSNKEIWEIFTRKEEYDKTEAYIHGRFPYYLSKYRDILNPIVSKFLVENGFKFHFPDDHKFAVCLTHDVDNLIYPLNSRIEDFISHKSILKFLKNPYQNLKETMKLEEKYNATSSFYFLADSSRYDLEGIKDELNYIVDNGWEVGLHGVYNSYIDINAIKQEKERLKEILKREVIGYRSHYLQFKIPDTWTFLSEAGFRYDTTLGFAEVAGFRNGMCHLFKPFNLNSDKEINIFEIPLTIMDNTLFEYMSLDSEYAWKMIKTLVDTVEKFNGVITIVWHNKNMTGLRLILYEKILKYCGNKKAWMTSGENILKWWENKNLLGDGDKS